MNNELKNIIEALLMVSDVPVGVSKIQGLFDNDSAPEAAEIKEAIECLNKDCESRSIEVKKIGSGYRFQTKPKYAEWIRKMQAGRPPRLSRAQLETLAIIAYRQPVTRGDIEEIRGVAVSGEIMQRLMEREWIKQVGVRDVPGRPALFGTTPEFLSYFSLESLGELPPLMDQRDFGDIARDLDIQLPPEVLSALHGDEPETQSDMFVEKDAEGDSPESEERNAVGNGQQPELQEIEPQEMDQLEFSGLGSIDQQQSDTVENNLDGAEHEAERESLEAGKVEYEVYDDEIISEIDGGLNSELPGHVNTDFTDTDLINQEEDTTVLKTDVEKTG